MLSRVFAIVPALMISGAAFAQAATPAAVQPSSVVSVPAKNDKSKMVCRREEELGSRLGGKRVCHTAQEWQDISFRAAQDNERRATGVHTETPGD